MSYIRNISRVVDNRNAHLCSCKFPLEDKHGKYDGYKHHSNWELHKQDHSDPNFAHYLKCTGCGYELAKKYWTDNNGNAIDYINPEGSINHIEPDCTYYIPEELHDYNISVYDVTFCRVDDDGNYLKDGQGNIIQYVSVGAELGEFSWNDVILDSLDDDCHTYIRESHRDSASVIRESSQEVI